MASDFFALNFTSQRSAHWCMRSRSEFIHLAALAGLSTIRYIEIIICQFSYHTPYQPETPISARDSRISPRAEGSRADTGVEG